LAGERKQEFVKFRKKENKNQHVLRLYLLISGEILIGHHLLERRLTAAIKKELGSSGHPFKRLKTKN